MLLFEMLPTYPPCNMQESARLATKSKRPTRTVLTGMCYSVGSATRQGSSSLTRLTGQSAMTSRTWLRGQPLRLPEVTFFCISDTLVPTTIWCTPLCRIHQIMTRRY
ncbi:hypothetical protein BKN43_10840 [Klebsiella quasipneumoniae]|nr:hypothetical protein BKN43_10840 [Klebsiella quasipneumoniae]